jgi:hypothetical protein
MDVKKMKSHLQWWEKHVSMYIYYWFFCPPNLKHRSITKWNENDFFKNLFLINLRRCHLQSNYFKFWYWLNDLKVDCKFHFNLIKLIEMHINLKEDLEKNECVLVWDEVVELWNFWKKLLLLYFHQNLNFFDVLKIQHTRNIVLTLK